MLAVQLARLQFAVTICFHFIFPPVSIGLGWLCCYADWMAWRRRDPVYAQVGRLFGKLFAITFVVGIASGVVMMFQLGTNWAGYSRFVANIFGGPLAVEGFVAFFLESTFMGLYLFGRGRVSKGVHWLSLFLVTLAASTVSAFPVIAANSWQQTPAGYVVRDGQAVLTSFSQAVFNPSAALRYAHVIASALVTGSFIFAGVGAWHVLRDRASLVGRKALKIGVACGLVFSLLQLAPFGHLHAKQVARTQPEKFAAMEGLYETQRRAPLVLFGVPSTDGGKPVLKARVEIPGLLSMMAFDDVNAEVRGVDAFPPEDRPPLWLTFVAFHNMLALGNLFILLTGLAAYRLYTSRIYEDRWLLKALVWAIPLPVVAIQLGWIATEVGRQPWVVYKLLRTSQAASPILSAGEIGFSLAVFSLIYLALLAAWLLLMIREAKVSPALERARPNVAPALEHA